MKWQMLPQAILQSPMEHDAAISSHFVERQSVNEKNTCDRSNSSLVSFAILFRLIRIGY